MKWFLISILLISSMIHAQDNDPKSAVMDVERARFAAMLAADTAALDSILAGEFLVTNSDGVTWTKNELLADLSAGKVKFDSLTAITDDIIIYDRTATVQGKFRTAAAVHGERSSFEAKHLRVYVYRANRWQLVARQITRVSK